jgi:8-hydroxy-5-deazaflavin:NADPH oxidoreductase
MTKERYTISILGGTGAEGSGLALRWARAGHSIIIGSRNPEKAKLVCAELNERIGGNAITYTDNRSAASATKIIVLTVPYAAQRATIEEVRNLLADKILIDTTVPLAPPKVSRVQLPAGGSAVAAVQALLGNSVRVVSAFQNISSHHLKDLDHVPECDVLVCGDDADARATAIGLAQDAGLRAYHAGPICNSAATEALTSLLIAINVRYKTPGAGIRLTGIPESAA